MEKLGIIAGGGELPIEIANFYDTHNGLCYIAGIRGNFDCNIFQTKSKVVNYQEFNIGYVSKIIEYFKSHNVTLIVFAGSIVRPNLKELKVDLLGAKLVTQILTNKFLGDDKLLRILANFLEQQGFRVISLQEIYKMQSIDYNKSSILPFKDITQMSDQCLFDIRLGMNVARALGTLDVGQSVIVQDGYVLGIEAAEGTDNLIIRSAALRKKAYGGVLIKIPKTAQDIRFDMPAIGPHTIQMLIKYNYSGLAICGKSNMIIGSHDIIQLINSSDIYIFDVNSFV